MHFLRVCTFCIVFLIMVILLWRRKKVVCLRSKCTGWECKHIITNVPFLNEEECYKLRKDADAKFNIPVNHGKGYRTLDTVDMEYDYQIDYTFEEFKKIVGKKADKIFELPYLLNIPKKYTFYLDNEHKNKEIEEKYKDNIIVRRYKPGERTNLDWHIDTEEISDITINVSLSDPTNEYKGGELMVNLDDKREVPWKRKMGHATIHRFDVLHKVNNVTEGTRYSLIIFMKKRLKD